MRKTRREKEKMTKKKLMRKTRREKEGKIKKN